jgi:hypothetical protein
VGPIPSAWAYGSLPLFLSSMNGTAGGKIYISFLNYQKTTSIKRVLMFYLIKNLKKKMY